MHFLFTSDCGCLQSFVRIEIRADSCIFGWIRVSYNITGTSESAALSLCCRRQFSVAVHGSPWGRWVPLWKGKKICDWLWRKGLVKCTYPQRSDRNKAAVCTLRLSKYSGSSFSRSLSLLIRMNSVRMLMAGCVSVVLPTTPNRTMHPLAYCFTSTRVVFSQLEPPFPSNQIFQLASFVDLNQDLLVFGSRFFREIRWAGICLLQPCPTHV